jgi:hypothetical protein
MDSYQGVTGALGEAFKSLTQKPATQFITDNVPAPSEAYISDIARIRVTIANTATAVSVRVNVVVLRADNGERMRGVFDFTPGTTGANQTFAIDLTEGFLVSLVITISGGATLAGQTFVRAQIEEGTGSGITVIRELLADYVTNDNLISWPGARQVPKATYPGALIETSFTAPGAGAEEGFAVTAARRWRIQAIRFSFVTSAGVANRSPEFRITNSGNIWLKVPIVGVIAASTTVDLVYMPGAPAPSLNNGVFILPLPVGLLLNANDNLSTVTANLQAGDQYGAPQVYAEEVLNG